MNEIPIGPSLRRSLLIRLAFIPMVATLLFAINILGIAMSSGQTQGRPPLLRVFWVGSLPAFAWVALSVPVQLATRRLVRERISVALLVHLVMAAAFHISHSLFMVFIRAAIEHSQLRIPDWDGVVRQAIGTLPQNLLVYAALVAGTLAWDNWRLSLRRERTAAHLAAELARADLAALRSRMQPHFLFNALHGISSVMDTDVPRARRMMVSLSHLLRSSISEGGEYASLEQELRFARDYLDLQHMRFEERLRYDVKVDARAHVRVPSFMLQPLVENAVIHGMADRPEPTWVHVAVRELEGEVEIDVSDNGPGFPQGILDGTRPLGVGLGALRARLLAMPNGPGTMTLRNRPEGGAQVILRVATHEEGRTNA